MRRSLSTLALLALVVGVAPAAARPDDPAHLGPRGLRFVENAGQWPEEFAFVARRGSLRVGVERDGFVLDRQDRATGRGFAVRVRLVDGGSTNPRGLDLLSEQRTFVSADGVLNPGTYQSVEQTPAAGVRLVLKDVDGTLKYDVLLDASTPLERATFEVDGPTNVHVDALGRLVFETGLGPIVQAPPVTWQTRGSEREFLTCRYVAREGNRFGFAVEGRDTQLPLTIDPNVEWCTFLGGDFDDTIQDIVRHPLGTDLFVCGSTNSRAFPVTMGAYDISFGGTTDAYVARMSGDGTTLIWATYLGGEGADTAEAIAVNSLGHPVVGGMTESGGYPTLRAFQSTKAMFGDCFITELSGDGRSLVYSTFLGSDGTDILTDLELDAQDQVYVCGSSLGEGFPITLQTALQPIYAGRRDAFFSQLDTNAGVQGLLYSSYLGGAQMDQAEALSRDNAGRIVLTGFTESRDLATTAGSLAPSFRGGTRDAFVAWVDLTAGMNGLVYGTFLGGTGDETGLALAVTPLSVAHVGGQTTSTNFPVTSAGYQLTQQGVSDGFLVEIDPGVAGSQALRYGTYFGGTEADAILDLAFAVNGTDLGVVGYTRSADFPTTQGTIDPTYGGADDGHVSYWDGARRPTFSTYLGGPGDDRVEALVMGLTTRDESLTVGGSTRSAMGIPTTTGSYQQNSRGGQEGFLCKIDSQGGTLQVVTPNGGETWRVDQRRTVAWISNGAGPLVDVLLSRDGGQTYPEVLAANIPNDGWEEFLVTGPPTNTARVRVVDAQNRQTQDASDADFRILDNGIQDEIRVHSPNGGEVFDISNYNTITWLRQGNSGSDVSIELSRDNGQNWETIFASTPNDGDELWNVTGPITSLALVRITSLQNPALTDVSDATFSIIESIPDVLRLTAPNGNEYFPIDAQAPITWFSQGNVGQDVSIELSRDAGQNWEVLFASTPNDGSETWTVTAPMTSEALVRITSLQNPSFTDVSDDLFDITASTDVRVVTPNGGEVLGIGTTTIVNWASIGTVGAFVDVELSRDNGRNWEMLFAQTPNDGAEQWTITGPVTTEGLVRVTSHQTPALTDTSDAPFVITLGGALDVVSPNGGELFVLGTTRTLRWQSSGNTGTNVQIELWRGTTMAWETLFASTANDGAEDWVVIGPQTEQALIRVTSLDDPIIQDESDAYFQILDAVPIQVTSPNGGEVWTSGGVQQITWIASPAAGAAVLLELSRDGGQNWDRLGIADATAGAFVYRADNPFTEQALVRVTSVVAPSLVDIGDAVHAIRPIESCILVQKATLRIRGTTADTLMVDGYYNDAGAGLGLPTGTVAIELDTFSLTISANSFEKKGTKWSYRDATTMVQFDERRHRYKVRVNGLNLTTLATVADFRMQIGAMACEQRIPTREKFRAGKSDLLDARYFVTRADVRTDRRTNAQRYRIEGYLNQDGFALPNNVNLVTGSGALSHSVLGANLVESKTGRYEFRAPTGTATGATRIRIDLVSRRFRLEGIGDLTSITSGQPYDIQISIGDITGLARLVFTGDLAKRVRW
ncbi:MAG: hypothetical protein H6833_11680 [Planctomycetes bacterium]|nr:hypothetical protein [Planctomycetota bacterium]